MKKILVIFLLFVLLFSLSSCTVEKKLSYEEMYDMLFDEFIAEEEKRVAAETKYELLLQDINIAYDEFLFVHQYLLGADDISETRAKEASTFVHDYLDIIRWDDHK